MIGLIIWFHFSLKYTPKEICNLANWDNTSSETTWWFEGSQTDNKAHPCNWPDRV